MTLIAGVQPPDSGKCFPWHVSIQPSLLMSIFASGEDGRGQRAVPSKGLQELSLTTREVSRLQWPEFLADGNHSRATGGQYILRDYGFIRNKKTGCTGYRDLGFRQ